jgi:uncharacterized membrane protein (DUF2068 family)
VAAKTRKGLKLIALLEALKGILALVLGLGLLSFFNHDNAQHAESIIRHLHLDPGRHYAHLFINLMADEADSQLAVWAGFATLYAAVRGAEAYGLWHGRRWAEWFAALSGAIYIPIEIYELIVRANWIKVGTLVVNIAIVGYMAWVLTESRRQAAKAAAASAPPT